MAYRVTAKRREYDPQGGRWRSGMFFPTGTPVVLPDGEVTDAIRQDPVLLVETLPDPAAQGWPELAAGGEAPKPAPAPPEVPAKPRARTRRRAA